MQGLEELLRLGSLDSALVYSVLSALDSVRTLVGVAVSAQSSSARLLALRALSAVCSTHQTIR